MFKTNQDQYEQIYTNISAVRQEIDRRKGFKSHEKSDSPSKVSPVIRTQLDSPLKDTMTRTLSNQKLKEQSSFQNARLIPKGQKNTNQVNAEDMKSELFAFKINQNIQQAYQKLNRQEETPVKNIDNNYKIQQIRMQNYVVSQNQSLSKNQKAKDFRQQSKFRYEPQRIRSKNNSQDSQLEDLKKLIINRKQDKSLRSIPSSPKNLLQNQIQDLRNVTTTLKNQIKSPNSNTSNQNRAGTIYNRQVNIQTKGVFNESYLLKLQENMLKTLNKRLEDQIQNSSQQEIKETEQKSFIMYSQTMQTEKSLTLENSELVAQTQDSKLLNPKSKEIQQRIKKFVTGIENLFQKKQLL